MLYRLLAAALLGSLVFTGTALGQHWPNRPLRVIIPYAPGGPTDILTRAVGQHLTETWGQQVLLDHRPGNSGHLGTAAAAKLPADGYNFNMVGISFSVAPSLGNHTGYDALRDFVPVSLIAGVNNVMVVHPSLPVKNVREFLALARRQPGALVYASGGLGGAQHLAGEYFAHLANIKMTHVPYKGAAPSVTALLSGEVMIGFADMLVSAPHVKSGRLRGLAVTGPTRSPAIPELPTVAESGLPGYAVTVWFGMLAPARTPADIVNRLQAEIARGLKTPAMRERLTAMGADPSGNTPEEFAGFLRSEIAKWAKVIKAAGLDKTSH
jgi:tripartite-type tricarboxylate transporter receptor subunit TctC